MKRHLLWLLPSFALAACGAEPTSVDDSNDTAGGETAVDPLAGRMPPPPVVTGPVDAPRDLILTVRVGGLAETFDAAARLMRESDADALDDVLTEATGSAVLARLVDRSRGAEFALVTAAGDPELVVAYDGPSMRDVLTALPASVSTEAVPDGALLVHETTDDGSRRECAIEPTSVPTRTRIVCARDIVELEIARIYLSRNFPTPLDAGRIEATLAVESLRARYGDDARAGLALVGTMAGTLLERASTESDVPESIRLVLVNTAARAKLEVLLRDVADDASALISDLESATAAIRIDGDAIHADVSVRIPSAGGSIVRAFSHALRPTDAVPDDLVARLPPGGAVYASGDWEGASLEDLTTEMRDLISAIAATDTRLPTADRDALERALAIAYRPQAYLYAVASGTDAQAAPWTVSAVRFASEAEARAQLDALRQYVAVLRRPAVARAFDRIFESMGDDRPRFAQIAEVRANGLPRGSYSVRLPAFEQLLVRQLSRSLDVPMPELPAAMNRTVVVVPNGADLLVVQAPDAAAVYRGLASSGGLPAEIRTALTTGGYASTFAIRLGNVRIPGGQVDREAGARTLESVLGTEAGQALSFVRIRDAGTGNDVNLEIAIDVPGALARGIAEAD